MISSVISLYFKSIRKLSSWHSYPGKSESKKDQAKLFLNLNPINHCTDSFACKFDSDLCAF